jgi:energy-coupling factor transport system substrate-specific component
MPFLLPCVEDPMAARRYYFSTRDLLMMAALAALGGISSTYVNMLGNLVHSAVGTAGLTQWAAGLHVLWLVLAVGLTRKQGAGTITGILKGGVELLTGNTHGLIVVLVDIVAGLLVDLAFLPFRRKESVLAYGLAGGLASASNVFVFQLFAALPADILAYGALLIVGAVALASGVVFAGLLGSLLVNALRRAGVVRDQPPAAMDRRVYVAFLAVAVLITGGLYVYLHQVLGGPAAVHVGGAVASPYDFPRQNGDIAQVTAEGTLRGVTTRYNGVPVREVLARAGLPADAAFLLVQGSDGYAFFISMAEVRESQSLLLAPKGQGSSAAYDLVGAQSSKAWVRDVAQLTVIGPVTLEIGGALDKPVPFDPVAWQSQMDSTQLDVGAGTHKYQGVPLGLVLEAQGPRPAASSVALYAAGAGEPAASLPLAQVLGDKDLRIFAIVGETDISFALARMSGEVLVPQLGRIEVR